MDILKRDFQNFKGDWKLEIGKQLNQNARLGHEQTEQLFQLLT